MYVTFKFSDPGVDMRKLGRIASSAIATATVAAGLTLGVTTQAHAAELGGVSVQGACNNQYPGTTAVVVANNVYGWRCRTYWSGGQVDYSGIDLSRQCRAQYGSGASANYLNYNDPYSWRCYR